MSLSIPQPRALALLQQVVDEATSLVIVERDSSGVLVGVRTAVGGRGVGVRVDVKAVSPQTSMLTAAGRAPRAVLDFNPDRLRDVIEQVFNGIEEVLAGHP
jgi:hypothetical protein